MTPLVIFMYDTSTNISTIINHLETKHPTYFVTNFITQIFALC